MNCLLLTKDHVWGRYATGIARHSFDQVTVFAGKTGDPFPEAAFDARPGILISFISPWIVPQVLLDRVPIALNFHPGSREYPGSGCYNFALYEEAAEYGCVCHHMLAKPDTGRIVAERRFALSAADTVESLQLKCFAHMIALFVEICDRAQAGDGLEASNLSWARRPFTRRAMEALKRLEPGMPPDEIRRRVRATVYPGYEGAYYDEPAGKRFVHPIGRRKAMAFDV